MCTDCTNDCRNCQLCEDHECDDCVAPDLTPRTAYALTVAGSVLADQCYDAIDEDTPSTPAERRELLPLPPALHAQNDDFIRQMARCFDDLTNDLDNGEWPQPHNLAEQLALHLMIDEAETQDADDLGTPEQLLPESRFDNDFDALYDVLFDDTDHTGLLQPQTPHPPGQLDYLFEAFHNVEDRDPTADIAANPHNQRGFGIRAPDDLPPAPQVDMHSDLPAANAAGLQHSSSAPTSTEWPSTSDSECSNDTK